MNILAVEREIALIRHQTEITLRDRHALESQNSELIKELERYKENERKVCDELQLRTAEVAQKENEINKLNKKLVCMKKEHTSDTIVFQEKLKEQSALLKECQDKVRCQHNYYMKELWERSS